MAVGVFFNDRGSLPEGGADTSRVGALDFLQNPLVLRCVLHRLIFRHDCCVYSMALTTPAHTHTAVGSGLPGRRVASWGRTGAAWDPVLISIIYLLFNAPLYEDKINA